MLRKLKKYNDEPKVEETKKSPSPDPTAPAQKTIIGEDISIKGSIHGKGNLVIQGSIEGNIDLDRHHLTIGPNGKVKAEVNAENVTISGRLTGNINAQGKVEITKTALFAGEIKAKRISVEDGAFLKAAIELERDSRLQDASKPSISIAKGPIPEKEKPK